MQAWRPVTLALLAAIAAVPAPAARLALRQVSLDLPAAPAAVVPSDVDGDGHGDLAVFLVYTGWGQEATWEQSEMDGVEGLVEMLTIVPALLDRRELWVFFGDGRGGLERRGSPLEMPLSVLALFPGPGAPPLLALTDEGVSGLEWRGGPDGGLELRPLVADRPVLAGTGVFLPELELLADATGDGLPDLLLPGPDDLAVYPAMADGTLAPAAAGRVPLPALRTAPAGRVPVRRYPLPEARDVTGDGVPDLVWRDPRRGWKEPWVARGRGEGRFDDPVPVDLGPLLESLPPPPGREVSVSTDREVVAFVDLDGRGGAEVAVQQMHPEPEDAGMRQSIRYAESPPSTFHVAAAPGLGAAADQGGSIRFLTQGHVFTGEGSDFQLPGGFRDLDGDGRQDLVTVSIGISITRLLGGLALGRVTLPLDFGVWCQDDSGAFRPVEGLDLGGTFRVDFDRMELRSLPSFAGDFDGDGRPDFVQLGRGKTVGIHTGGAGCRFPTRPDLTVRLREEAAHMELVRVADLDGDARADLMVIVPGRAPEARVSIPARLDLYLSGGGS